MKSEYLDKLEEVNLDHRCKASMQVLAIDSFASGVMIDLLQFIQDFRISFNSFLL